MFKKLKENVIFKFKEILGIHKLEEENLLLKDRVLFHENFVNNKMVELKEYTHVDADVGIRSNNTIILTGVFRKKGYVQFYDIGDAEFESMVKRLRQMNEHCLIRNIDKPQCDGGVFDIF